MENMVTCISEIIDLEKSLTSEQLSVINLLTGNKHCLNLHGTTIILILHESLINWAGKSALVRSKILGLFVNTLTAEYTYSRRNMQTCTQQVQSPLSLKEKTFSGFFIAFLKSTWNGEHFQKKGESCSLRISEIIDSKWDGKYLKRLTSEQLSVTNLLTDKHCLNLFWDWKKSALVRSKILGLFVNTLTAEYTYSRRNMQTLTQQVQTPLSLKQKIFSGFFIAFLKSTWNGEHFEKKGESSSLSISEIIDSKRGGYLSAWKALLQNSFR